MYQYEVDGHTFDDPEAIVEYCFSEDDIDESEYDDFLNECYGEVNICGYEYQAAYALKEVDPTAYRCGCADWYSDRYEEMKDDLIEEVNGIEPGEEGYINGWSVKCIEISEDDDLEDDDDDIDEEDGDENET